MSTQISNSEKIFEQYAESFTTPVGSRVVLDTSVLVADPNCLHSFPNCAIVIPLTVIEELDGLKTRMDDVGRSARSALRSIEDLRRKAGGSLKDPTPVNGNDSSGTVQIEVNGIQHHLLIEHGLDPKVPDNRIIGAALGQPQFHQPASYQTTLLYASRLRTWGSLHSSTDQLAVVVLKNRWVGQRLTPRLK